MMNEDKPIQQNSLVPEPPAKTGLPTSEEHPLHMLDNQADPETKPKVVLQKAIRTYESDMAELLAKRGTSTASMAIAEQQRRNPPPQRQVRPSVMIRNSKIAIADLTGTNPLENPTYIEPLIPVEKPKVESVDIKKKDVTPVAPVAPEIKNVVVPEVPKPIETPVVNNNEPVATSIVGPAMVETGFNPENIARMEKENAAIPTPITPPAPEPAPIPEPEPEPEPENYSSIPKQTIYTGQNFETETPIKVEEEKSPRNFSRKLFMLLLSVIFIGSGLGGGYYLYQRSPLAVTPPTPTTTKIPSILNPESQKIIPVGSLKMDAFAQKIQNLITSENIGDQKTTEYIFTQAVSSTTLRVTGPDFIEILGYSAPEIFKRSLLNNWMFGVYGQEAEKVPYIILKTNFFQNAFAGILRWETTMPDEFATLLNYKEKIRTLSRTGSSTIATYFSVKGKFEDRVVLNRDVREFITEGKETLLLYSFIDKDTLVITTSKPVLKSIIEKLEKQPYIR